MNPKFFFIVLIVAMIAACAPVVNEVQQPASPETGNDPVALIPVTSNSSVEVAHRETKAPALISGAISFDSNSPDLKPTATINVEQQTTAECRSEDNQPQPQSGCIQ